MPDRYEDHPRREEQARRQRIMDGTWRDDAYEYLRRLLGSKRLDNAWGGRYAVDITTNILREDADGKSTLYDRTPRVRCLVDGAEVDSASLLMDALLDAAHYPVLMPDVLSNTLALNDYCIRYDVQPDGDGVSVQLHPVSPARVVRAEPEPRNPRQPAVVVEEWETPDGKPAHRVWTESETWLQHLDGREIEGTREMHEQGACPWVLYHVHGRPQLWLPYYRSEVVESTYRTCMAYSNLDHNLFEAAWAQRYTINLVPVGADQNLADDGTATPVVEADATSVLQLESVDPEKPGSAGQWNPGADPEVMGRAVARLHGRATLAAGGSDLAVYRKSGNAESAYAMAITREMQREAQIRMAPRMAPSDRLLCERIATAANVIVPGLFPAGADWRVRYRALPPSADEMDRLERAVAIGAMTRADMLMAIDPFMTAAEAAAGPRQEADDEPG